MDSVLTRCKPPVTVTAIFANWQMFPILCVDGDIFHVSSRLFTRTVEVQIKKLHKLRSYSYAKGWLSSNSNDNAHSLHSAGSKVKSGVVIGKNVNEGK